jgi:hypothetical protein
VHQELAKLQDAISKTIAGMTPERLACHPNGKWSSANILDHLNLTYLGTIKNFERCLAAGRPGAGPDRHSKRWQRRAIVWLGIFPRGRKSPERVLPRGTPAEQLTKDIFQNIARMDEVITKCEIRFGPKPLAEHPILGPLTGDEWRRFHLVHGKHHARQIAKLKMLY